ncbi:MAG: prolipoprotein diacylglyceryl transferase [Anaerolineae bacterium]|nr:prolipoprotein diacylglyceryl transferase [Anaerolineae bacterium]MDW8068798.1 prolipoprotein diacylglyceryl transferase [Anaerolineae bacterium]
MALDFLSRLPLPDYRAALTIGVLVGIVLSLWVGRRNGLPISAVLDGALAAAVGGLLIGRLGYVAVHLAYFREHPMAALAFGQGGLSAPGVVVGGVAGAVILASIRRQASRPLLDALAPGAAVVLLAAYLGCLRAGCACGRETWPEDGLLWTLSADLPDLYGLRAPRVAVPVLGMGWGAIMLALTLWATQRRRRAGGGSAPGGAPIWLALYGLGEFALGFLRGDAPAWVGGLSALQWAGLGFLGAGIILGLGRKRIFRADS